MRILAIETSCDETAIAVLECKGTEKSAGFTVLGNALLSQIDLHREYGGVFPALAKREHAKNLVPMLESALQEAELLHEDTQALLEETRDKIAAILSREQGLAEAFFAFITETEAPNIDAIAVTTGPGLEPALWVGINFAKALGIAWGKPLISVNHMEGHIFAALAKKEDDETLSVADTKLPVLALLISGGHTELVSMHEWLSYKLIGQTRDDAVGEAFDKVARMLGLPYPGGPEISRLAERVRSDPHTGPDAYGLPRPMLHEPNCDFSFSGLKTAVLYLLKNRGGLSERQKQEVAHEFENAVTDVLWKKTARALEGTGAQTLVIGGGVSANRHIRRTFLERMQEEFPERVLSMPPPVLTTDNAIMIGLAGFFRAQRESLPEDFVARGNQSLA